jgi:hypothetical protein
MSGVNDRKFPQKMLEEQIETNRGNLKRKKRGKRRERKIKGER